MVVVLAPGSRADTLAFSQQSAWLAGVLQRPGHKEDLFEVVYLLPLLGTYLLVLDQPHQIALMFHKGSTPVKDKKREQNAYLD